MLINLISFAILLFLGPGCEKKSVYVNDFVFRRCFYSENRQCMGLVLLWCFLKSLHFRPACSCDLNKWTGDGLISTSESCGSE
jgi:hypothetical protein